MGKNRKSKGVGVAVSSKSTPRSSKRNIAQPDEALTSAYKKFLVRSMTQLKATDEEMIDNQVPARSFGTVLAKNAGNQVLESSDIFRKKQKLDRTPGTTFSIFKDNGSSSLPGHQPKTSKLHKTTPWHSLGARSERNKENNTIPSKWTSKIPQRPGVRPPRPAPGPCIEIFVDEKCTEWERASKESPLELLDLHSILQNIISKIDKLCDEIKFSATKYKRCSTSRLVVKYKVSSSLPTAVVSTQGRDLQGQGRS